MASLEKDESSGFYRARFRFRGKSYKRSLKTRNERDAHAGIARIDETIRLLESGRIEIPGDADVPTFIMSDGKLTGNEGFQSDKLTMLGELLDTYSENIPAGAKEQSTLDCEAIHIRHLKRHFGVNKKLTCVRVSDAQSYLNTRLKKKHRGRTIKPQTVRTQWKDVRGFHVFRHSFASNLACKGIDQRLIDEWMGHQTEELRRRYRPLFPDQQRQAIDSVFGPAIKVSACFATGVRKWTFRYVT